jgi:hypothetical protein
VISQSASNLTALGGVAKIGHWDSDEYVWPYDKYADAYAATASSTSNPELVMPAKVSCNSVAVLEHLGRGFKAA